MPSRFPIAGRPIAAMGDGLDGADGLEPTFAEETPRLPLLKQKEGSPVTLWKGRPLDG